MRRDLQNVGTPDHVALAYGAWAPVGNDGKVPVEGKKPIDTRTEWLGKLANTIISPDYASSFERWKHSFSSAGDRFAQLTLTSRMLVGHGNSSAIDVGLTVHHTWGIPVIPGSALKGLAAHYVDATYGPTDPGKLPWEQQDDERARTDYQGVTWNGRRIDRGPGAIYRALFGAPNAREDDAMREHDFEAGAAAGRVTFHDALYVPDSSADNKPLAADVLTVHQKRYYDNGLRWTRWNQHRRGQEPDVPLPNDYDDPNPVAFLTVRPKICLLLVLSGPSEWTELAGQLLQDALETWGAGGKTSAGYGIGTVGHWEQPVPRRSSAVQAVFDLKKHGKDALRGDIEKWLRGEPVAGPLRDLLAAPPDATPTDRLGVVRAIGEEFELRDAWSGRVENRKADERKKGRARALIKAWDELFPEEPPA